MTSNPVSLLIVDDDPVFAMFVQQLVRALGQEMSCELGQNLRMTFACAAMEVNA